jgi:hypothetical protein
MNWYAALVVIVVLGLASVFFARSAYRNAGASSKDTTPPTVGTTWNAGFAFDICGTLQSPIPKSNNTGGVAMTTPGNGVLDIKPTTKAQAGNNAVLGLFTAAYPIKLTQSELAYPGQKTYTNGETCPKGTPDAGKKGTVQLEYFPNAQNNGVSQKVSGDPNKLKPANNSLFTMAFVPEGAKIPRPAGSVVLALEQAVSAQTTTTTTSSPTTASTVPATGSTTTPTTGASTPSTSTPTTAAGSTTTSTPASTSTTATTAPKT